MGADTKIEWAHHTFNPWFGCAKVSPPCDFCYAEVWAKRSGLVEWGARATRRLSSAANWKKPVKWNAEAKAAGIRYRVFCASLADWLDNKAKAEWRESLAALIDETPYLDWLLLTKRIQNFDKIGPWHNDNVPANVWLGITCGDQREYDRAWPILCDIQARVRFISYEPALGPLRTGRSSLRDPHWFIAGGESGGHARPSHPQWFRDLRDDCARNNIAFLFKQWGEFAPRDVFSYAKADSHVYRIGKKAAGRLLDGREHNEFPTPDGPAVIRERTPERSALLNPMRNQ